MAYLGLREQADCRFSQGKMAASTCVPYHVSEADHDDQMPTHVIWGEVDSGSHVTSHNESTTSSISSSDIGNHTKKKKLKNKRLNYIPQRREWLSEDIQFRSRSEDSASNMAPTPEDVSEKEPGLQSPEVLPHHFQIRSQSGDVAQTSQEVGWKLAPQDLKDVARGSRPDFVKTPANFASCQWRGENRRVEDDEDSETSVEMEVALQQQPQSMISNFSPEELEELRGQVRLDSQGLPTSIGSAGHELNCKPCFFVHTSFGCQNGISCHFCHFPHRRGTKPRPCKGKRSRYRKLMNRMEQLVDIPDGSQSAETKEPREKRNAEAQQIASSELHDTRSIDAKKYNGNITSYHNKSRERGENSANAGF